MTETTPTLGVDGENDIVIRPFQEGRQVATVESAYTILNREGKRVRPFMSESDIHTYIHTYIHIHIHLYLHLHLHLHLHL